LVPFFLIKMIYRDELANRRKLFIEAKGEDERKVGFGIHLLKRGERTFGEKLDTLFPGFLRFVLIVEALSVVRTLANPYWLRRPERALYSG
jgi:hypothetical protein